ncbi:MULTISPECIES: pyridoxal-phosphate-dependent aminotransferase family protein [Bradyrhizobium]|jgi:alanine-glyoxylate transaminase/serine-glyoxylate transaminase/serine-pyruvate transaminase|uniref:Aminotransferase class V-fold PLP-dependent enzyme n=1 Tax=Bradyrhizobium denitrificans TaxID=2734912 RepID=A0ABS5GCH3_9BRAD|nr:MULTISPECIES: aminotransferase class V-fold PLP-dependent enzyme [Bradyrhizobium]MBR1139011.1 aminotransferase class V-fold PLP-dependent enzyme [Bradyrhizobium denitrificans]MDU1496787.1 aminotransferase class V-fold PLP-dependent enzyme [Bradyrhizobium sp.]MDU1546897.1 aminotransferase class V-fold PLP-dependent enzyme [Bradyrhizobium sp.]MDU1667394.1 aminotransferase class V-fold PLP-dependent enzyme [Bradyrhizobium sp.]MDU1802444.1 aminotransferase class V-fold PLP-dependent enzyme [Bra
MTVRAGREFLAIPGPTTMPDEVLQAMHRPALDIYSKQMVELTDGLMADLGRLFATKGKTYIYIANGHGAWEAVLSNVLSRGDKLLVLESGRFAIGWGQAARAMGAEIEVIRGDWRRAVRPAEVEARLRADREHTIKAIVVAQIDTASGVVNDVEAIGRAIKASGHPALYMVDTVASLGCMPFEMDAWGIDVAMSGSQKGLMTPPGLGFVAANARALEAHKRANMRTPYWDWSEREGAEHYRKYGGTAPVHLLFALRQAIDMLFAEGLPHAFRRHQLLGEAVRRAVAKWSEGQVIGFNIADAAERSNTVTTVLVGGGYDPAVLQSYCKEQCGVVLGTGIGDLSGKAFRIAHMGHVNAPMVLGTLGVIEMALVALKIPHGRSGLDAAIQWLGESVSA